MPTPIEFYFDFSSPYGYLASGQIDALAVKHDRDVAWRPVLLGVVFKITGHSPLPSQPMRGEYALHDWPRFARMLGMPYRHPEPFPISTIAPARAFYWLADRDRGLAKRFARAAFHAYFAEGRDISGSDAVVEVAAGLGVDAGEVAAAIQEPALKERLKREVQAAIDKGVFGSPFFIVDGEPFWGADRLDQLENWLRTGGW